MKRAISFLPVLFAFAGAAHADAPITSEARTVSDFHAIDVAGTLSVDVAVGKATHVDVSGEADLIDKITTTVQDGTLVLDTKIKKLPRKSHLKVTITVPSLDALKVGGTGDLKIKGVAAERFAIDVAGTGQIKIAGETRQLDVSIAGTGNLDAEGFAAKNAKIDVRGTGAASIRATESVAINVSGTGSVEVVGNPAKVTKKVTGVGSVSVH
jgi:hypothetical protein